MSAWARMLAISGLAAVLVGCDPSHQLAIHNMTSRTLIVRITETTYAEDFGVDVSSFEVPANAMGQAFPQEIGALEGTVEVFDADCNLLGTIPARNGSVVLIAEDLSLDIRYLGSEDYERPIRQLTRSDLCR